MLVDKSQLTAAKEMANGKILCGDVGSGKSRTSLIYFYIKECEGSLELDHEIKEGLYDLKIKPAKKHKDLYIITTAKKRESLEWIDECEPFGIKPVKVDSWNNIKKYIDVQDSVFIFDEQRLVGSGTWVKSFYKIAKKNNWILLSATPGDTWSDYIPVFVANGFYKNKTEFINRHAVYSRYSKYPKIDRWLEELYLRSLRDKVLVDIEYVKKTERHYRDVTVEYDRETFKYVFKERWDIYNNEPIKNASGLCYILRKVVNANEARIRETLRITQKAKRAIIFYNFDYELDMLREMCENNNITYAEWNGHKHQDIPDTEEWAYLVQYTAGAEGWNCITTDTVIFYSLNYSYKTTMQAAGRIDRRNTPYTDLYYYFIKTSSWIDRAIKSSLDHKKTFNESRYIQRMLFA